MPWMLPASFRLPALPFNPPGIRAGFFSPFFLPIVYLPLVSCSWAKSYPDPGRTSQREMSRTRILPPPLRWASVPRALAAASIIAVGHGNSAHAMDLVHSRALQPPYEISAPSILGWKDAAAAFNHDDSITTPQYLNYSSCDTVFPWHPRTIDYTDLVKVATIQDGRLEVVQHPDLLLGATPVLVKRAALPEYIESIARETDFYRLLDGVGVTPLFLGHVAEGGVVTGFVAEYVEQQHHQQSEEERARYRARGTEACLSALRRMHGVGIGHRDAHGGNCLVRGDGSAVLVDFELAEGGSSAEEFERDLWVMRHSRDAEDEM